MMTKMCPKPTQISIAGTTETTEYMENPSTSDIMKAIMSTKTFT